MKGRTWTSGHNVDPHRVSGHFSYEPSASVRRAHKHETTNMLWPCLLVSSTLHLQVWKINMSSLPLAASCNSLAVYSISIILIMYRMIEQWSSFRLGDFGLELITLVLRSISRWLLIHLRSQQLDEVDLLLAQVLCLGLNLKTVSVLHPIQARLTQFQRPILESIRGARPEISIPIQIGKAIWLLGGIASVLVYTLLNVDHLLMT